MKCSELIDQLQQADPHSEVLISVPLNPPILLAPIGCDYRTETSGDCVVLKSEQRQVQRLASFMRLIEWFGQPVSQTES
jgi:hypothetical protein